MLLAAAAVGWYLAKEPAFRRDPWLELMGVARVAPTYEASYRDCPGVRDTALNRAAQSLTMSWTRHFPAWNDAQAAAFARAALPQCRLDMLTRKPRWAWTRTQRKFRIVVDIAA
jgi:hypothetical protein